MALELGFWFYWLIDFLHVGFPVFSLSSLSVEGDFFFFFFGGGLGDGHPLLAFKTSPFTSPSLTSCLVAHMMSLSRVDYSSGVFCSGNRDCIIANPIEDSQCPVMAGSARAGELLVLTIS